MKDKICLVTGANSGLGKAIALEFARSGGVVVMLCRDPGRGETARAEIQAASGNPNIMLLVADLAVQQSVRQAVEIFKKQYDCLDVLVNNAAAYKSQRVLTPDGLETMFAANHLGHFLLTNLLLDRLKASSAARVIHLTAPVNTPLDFDDLQSEHGFSTLTAFGRTKMCNLLFNAALAERLAGTNVTSNAFHPGIVKSNIMNEAALPMRLVIRLFGASPEKAAQAVAYLSSAPELAGETGKFFKGKTIIEPDAYALDRENQRRLWEASVKLAHLEAAPA